MPFRLTVTFLGAAGHVTGSRFLLDAGRSRVLVDCGLNQEREYLKYNWEEPAVAPSTIQAVLLTHAHLDHCGLLPRFVAQGFNGQVHATAPTEDMCRLLLQDSASIMREDAEAKQNRHVREGRRGPYPEAPLYTAADVERAMRLFSTVQYGRRVPVARHISAEFQDAGHILGSASIRLAVDAGGEERSILFSGDLGQTGRPIVRDPSQSRGADYVVVETTYGDRDRPKEDVEEQLAQVIRDTVRAGGDIVIPSFAVERAQELLFHLGRLVGSGRIPVVPVYVDSPMATNVTYIFEKYAELTDPDVAEALRSGRSPFEFSGMRYAKSRQESEGIARTPGSKVIIAGSGMATGGRIKHHLVTNIGRPESTVLFVGYQARGTLGRQILEGDKLVRILGSMHPVRARIERINGFSAHADRAGLLGWIQGLRPAPRKLFLVHGEREVSESFAELLRMHSDAEVFVPEQGEAFEIAGG